MRYLARLLPLESVLKFGFASDKLRCTMIYERFRPCKSAFCVFIRPNRRLSPFIYGGILDLQNTFLGLFPVLDLRVD